MIDLRKHVTDLFRIVQRNKVFRICRMINAFGYTFLMISIIFPLLWNFENCWNEIFRMTLMARSYWI